MGVRTTSHARVRRSAAALVATALAATAVAACDTAPSDTGSSSSSATSAVTEPVDPNTVVAQDLPADAVETAVGRLDGLVESLMASTGIPGMAVAVVHGGESVYAKGFGVAEVGTDRKVDADTVFPLASMSKPLGSTVIAKLITDKVVGWDTPVAENLPGFALSDLYVSQNVTIGDMYAHRSGLPDHAGDKLEELGYDREQVLARMRYVPLDPFRVTYNYTNFGVTAAAESAARKSGKDWETLSEQALYGPLGMTHTSSRFRDFEAEPDRVVGHVQADGKWVKTPQQRDPDAQAPAGGVSSSVNDLTHWMAMLLGNGMYAGKQIVGADALLPAVTPEIVSSPAGSPDARAGYYGYGFNVSVTEGGRTQYSHSGAFSMGAGTNFLVMPSADVAIVALSNAAPIGAVDALTGEFADIVQFGEVRHDWRTLYGDAYAAMAKPSGSLVGQQPPADLTPAQPLSTYAGTYRNDVYGPAVVREQNGKLILALGPGGATTHELGHWDGNTYTFTLRTENAEPGSISKVTFDGAGNEPSPRMTIEYYDDEMSNGEFTRT
ncbi:serine hydrolase [Gordonia sp. SID5947]|uniref:serine hydrolase n=1 Tax=Gordonia sp. SID5947 TaxID=2690315 RepID=UPI00136C733C|nr:serine hydrolase [Gordonia sp. SID5947]MYR07050.1 serine hydrolase [Gordonia sp. SID5947]